jgi:hypothetical protein
MCWGFDCGDGWYDLLDTLCWMIQSHINHANEDMHRNIEWNDIALDAREGRWEKFNQKYADTLAKDTEMSRRAAEYYRNNCLNDPIRLIGLPVAQVVATQVKEKFGGLRFYVSGGDEKTNAYIMFAEAMSYKICEVCGKPGRQRGSSWLVTLCDEHAAEREQTNEHWEDTTIL